MFHVFVCINILTTISDKNGFIYIKPTPTAPTTPLVYDLDFVFSRTKHVAVSHRVNINQQQVTGWSQQG